MIRLRFVTCSDEISEFIRLQAGICMPFTPSHVECISQDGKTYIGQHLNGGLIGLAQRKAAIRMWKIDMGLAN